MEKQILYGMIEFNEEDGINVDRTLYATPKAAILASKNDIEMWAKEWDLTWEDAYNALINRRRYRPYGGECGGYAIYEYVVAG